MTKMILVLALVNSLQPAPIATPSNKFAWDQDAPSLSQAQAYTYKYYLDNSPTGGSFSGVICTGTATPFNCSVPVPSMSQGTHSMTLTSSNVAGESSKSSPFVFDFVATPGTPGNIRIIGG